MEKQQANRIVLAGVVEHEPHFSHEFLNEKFYSFDLYIQRLSGNADILPVIVPERSFPGVIHRGDFVEVSGQVRSYNQANDTGTKLLIRTYAFSISSPVGAPEFRNEVSLSATITRQPVYRTTPFGKEIADLLWAVNRAHRKSDYIPSIAWGRCAKLLSDYACGDKLSLEGRLQSREYKKRLSDETVQTRTAYEVSIMQFHKIIH